LFVSFSNKLAIDHDRRLGQLSISDEAWRILAETFGLVPEYTDNWGKPHRTDPETAGRFLEAKGVHLDPELAAPVPEVLVVSSDGRPDRSSFHFDVPRGSDSSFEISKVEVRAVDQDGLEQCRFFDAGEISVDLDEKSGRMRVSTPFPSDLREGVYRITAEAHIGEKVVDTHATWILCPNRSYIPREIEEGRRIAGVGVALYGLRSENNWGVGDFSDLTRIVDWAADDLGVDFVGLNPLHALFNRRPFNASPYLPSSRLFRNFIYLDVPGIPDFHESVAAKSMLDHSNTRNRIERLRNEENVNYEEVSALKIEVLRELFRAFMENHGSAERETSRWAEFQSYTDSGGTYLEKFATFCALDDHFRSGDPPANTWRDWPGEYRDPAGDAVKKFQAENREALLFHMYIQWQLEDQLKRVQEYALGKGMLLGLYHDEALAVDRNGADFWALQGFFHDGFKVGAPPDAFAPDGQDWGFAPPNREKFRSSGYEPFIKKLRANCKYGGALRIDHVMQLNRLFWIPEDKKPVDGAYVKDYESDLLNILALESRRSRAVIIGEDLGTVPPDLRERLMAKGIFSYRLFYFERDGEGNQVPFSGYPENAAVSIGTHDLPTLAGFWSGLDIDLRREIGQLDADSEKTFREERVRHKAKIIERLVQDGVLPEHTAHAAWESPRPTADLHSAVLRFLFQTPSRIVIVNQEDIFLDVRQQNIPGTTYERPNWVTKMIYSVEDLNTDPEAVKFTRKFRDLLENAGRCAR